MEQRERQLDRHPNVLERHSVAEDGAEDGLVLPQPARLHGVLPERLDVGGDEPLLRVRGVDRGLASVGVAAIVLGLDGKSHAHELLEQFHSLAHVGPGHQARGDKLLRIGAFQLQPSFPALLYQVEETLLLEQFRPKILRCRQSGEHLARLGRVIQMCGK